MESPLGVCDENCSACVVFIATKRDDHALREQIATAWTGGGNTFKPKDMNCDGCHAPNGRKAESCASCMIRKCGREKQLENCAHCEGYPSEELTRHFKFAGGPQRKVNLEEIRRNLTP